MVRCQRDDYVSDKPMIESHKSIYPEEHKAPFWMVFAFATVGVVLVGMTVWTSYQSICDKDPIYVYGIIAIWAVGPPVWFWAEYFGIYLRWGNRESFDLFKYGQQVATAIWAGVFALLVLFVNSGATDPAKEIPSLERCQNMCGVGACRKNRIRETVIARRMAMDSAPALNRIVLLGASNLTLSLRLVTRLLQQRFGHPSDVLVAAGHGRSYGHSSQVMIRGLPGITGSDLWTSLESKVPLPTYAFLTDIGNDIPYGHAPEHLLKWVATCVEKLQRQNAHIVATNLSLELLENLTPWHFHLIRSLFFPFSQLTFDETIERVRVVHRGLEQMSLELQFELYEPDSEWYGPDIIHVLYWKRYQLYRRIVGCITSDSDAPVNLEKTPRHLATWKHRPKFACKTLCGREFRHAQPSGLLTDGSIVSMY